MHNEGHGIIHKYMHTSKMTAHKMHNELEKVGLYRGQPPLLFALWKKDGQSGTELCRILGVQPATVTKMVKRLKNNGFVFTRRDENDSRVTKVCLTEKGRRIEEDVKGIYGEFDRIMFKDFDEEQVKSLEFLLDKIQSNISSIKAIKRGVKNG